MTVSGMWAGQEGIKDGARHLPTLCQPTPSCLSTGPQATSWPIVPSEKADTGGGLPCGRSSLMHACLAGTAAGEPPPCWVRGEGRRGAVERGAPTV